MKKILSGFFIIAFSCLITGCAAARQPQQIGISELGAHSESYYGKMVEVDACILVSRHGMAVADCEDRKPVIDIDFPDPAHRNPEINKLLREAQNEWAPGEDGVLKATLIGTLSLKDNRKTLTVVRGEAVGKETGTISPHP